MDATDKLQTDNRQPSELEGQFASSTHSFARKVILVYSISLLFIGTIAVVWMAAEVLLLIFAGTLFAVLLNAAVRFTLRYLPLPRILALGIVLLSLLLILALGGYFLAPQIAAQFEQLVKTISRAIETLEQYLRGHSWGRVLMEQALPPPEKQRITLPSF